MNEAILTAGKPKFSLSARALGTFGMLASPLMLVSMFIYMTYGDEANGNRLASVAQIFYIFGWICSATAMRSQRITGDGAAAKIVFVVQMILLTLAALLNVQEIIFGKLDALSFLFIVTDAGYPLSHLFMLVVGGFVLKAKVWRDWRRFAPLLCGLALPATMLAGAFLPREAGGMLFGAWTLAAFLMLGYAVRIGGNEE